MMAKPTSKSGTWQIWLTRISTKKVIAVHFSALILQEILKTSLFEWKFAASCLMVICWFCCYCTSEKKVHKQAEKKRKWTKLPFVSHLKSLFNKYKGIPVQIASNCLKVNSVTIHSLSDNVKMHSHLRL